MFANQRRLIAPGERVNDAGRLGTARQQRPRHRVGLDIDHDDMLAVLDCFERVMDAGARHAGRFDDHFDARVGNQGLGVGGDECRAALMRVGERGSGVSLRRPARGS